MACSVDVSVAPAPAPVRVHARVMSALLATSVLLAAAGAAASPLTPAPAPPPPATPLSPTPGTNTTKLVSSSDKKLVVKLIDISWLSLTCPDNSSIDSLSKQPFEERKVFRRLNVSKCPPDGSSYRSVLDALNATLIAGGGLTVKLPAGGQALASRHLDGLELARLDLYAFNRRRPPAGVADDLLAGQRVLRGLVVRNVPVSAAVLANSCDNLTSLVLDETGADRVPAALLARLDLLSVKSESPVQLEGGAPALHTLSLLSAGLAGSRTNWTHYPSLTTLTLTEWHGPPEPEPWVGCGSLRDLTLTRSTVTALPARWLGACCALRELKVYYACRLDVSALPDSLLAGCGTRHNLTKMVLRNGAKCSDTRAARVRIAADKTDARAPAPGSSPQVRMPAVFGLAPNLRELDLSNNGLTSLDGKLFVYLIALEKLYLSGNRFDKSIYKLMSALTTLHELDLSENKLLGDACAGTEYVPSGPSPLRTLTQLRMLDLSHTGVSLICQDWREKLLRLKTLKLDSTNITRLSMRDLQISRGDDVVDAEVSLLGTRVAAVNYSDEDVRRVLDGSLRPSRARILLNSPLDCDCYMYNARYAWNEDTKHVTFGIPKPKCGTVAGEKLPYNVDVDQVPIESLMCQSNDSCEGMPGCRCWVRPQLEPHSRAPAVLRAKLDCEGLGLDTLPLHLYPFDGNGMDPPAVEWELHFRNNNITVLSAMPRAPRGSHVIKKLDLRDNKLNSVSRVALDALSASATNLKELQLGNELDCDCDAAPLLRAVAALRVTGTDLGDARCGGVDNRTLINASADVAECVTDLPAGATGGVGVTLGVTLGSVVAVLVLLLAALAAGVALARPSRRARLKGVLLEWGWLPRPDADAHSFDYDAFVSFVMADVEFVNEMAVRLERGAAPLRLCLHHRDWPPGEFVPAQIAHSVRRSRRTVAVVSHHFLTSEWVRAEFYEALAAGARDGAPRLVVVLLEDPRELRLGRGLRQYVANNTYLHRDNPEFWTLLRKAVQAPSSPAVVSASTPTLETAPASTPTLEAAPASTPTLETALASKPTLETTPASTPTLETAPPLARTPSLSESTESSSTSDSSSTPTPTPTPTDAWRGPAATHGWAVGVGGMMPVC